jgi:hypothetical protein
MSKFFVVINLEGETKEEAHEHLMELAESNTGSERLANAEIHEQQDEKPPA